MRVWVARSSLIILALARPKDNSCTQEVTRDIHESEVSDVCNSFDDQQVVRHRSSNFDASAFGTNDNRASRLSNGRNCKTTRTYRRGDELELSLAPQKASSHETDRD